LSSCEFYFDLCLTRINLLVKKCRCKLRDSFKKHANEEGKIDREAFSTLLRELGFSPLPVDQLFRLFDVAGVGQISYRAFLTQMSTLKDESSDAAIRFCFDVYVFLNFFLIFLLKQKTI